MKMSSENIKEPQLVYCVNELLNSYLKMLYLCVWKTVNTFKSFLVLSSQDL